MLKLKRVADEEGLLFGERTMTYNSRLAQELGKWAEVEGRGEALHTAVFKAYFAEGRNIARETVLADVAASAGLDPEMAGSIIQNRTFQDAVDTDWRRAFELGITAVPTFLMDGRRLVGAQPYHALEKFVSALGIPRFP